MFRVVILIVFLVCLIMSPNDVDVSDSTDSNFLVTFDNFYVKLCKCVSVN